MKHYAALDLGAESGRVMLGALIEDKLQLEEVHRFPNGALAIGDSFRWDILRLYEEIGAGLGEIARRGIVPAGISTDSWGVDTVYFREGEPMLTVPFHYRDARTDGAVEAACARVPAETIFDETGLQFMSINTLCQFLRDQESRSDVMALADSFLGIGDYFNYLLSGVPRAEESLASTTQLYNPRLRAWSKTLIDGFGFPEKIFPKIVPSGTVLGPLANRLADKLGWSGTQIVASCSHDTGAAVAAVPAEAGEDWAYLSSGTWSLLGIESAQPIIGPESRALNFTNEAGLGGTTRFLKNIVGLWIVQECRRAWQREGHDHSYDDLGRLAGDAAPLVSLINPSSAPFGKPGEMPQKVAAYCAKTGQPVPATPGAIVRCAYESLALQYRLTLEQIERELPD